MSFDIALSGLNTSATQLDVVAHNISNSATTGFKSSRVEFTDVYVSITDRGVVGQGDKIAQIRQSHSSGTLTDTGKVLDLSVDGNGYFRMSSPGGFTYTRNGAFAVDREGFIVNSNGEKLTGYNRATGDTLSPTLSDLFVDPADQKPTPTTVIDLGVNLNASADIKPPFDINDSNTFNFTSATTVYDTLGSPTTLTVYFRKEAPNTWTVYSYMDNVEVGQAGGDELVFNAEGNIATVNGSADAKITLPTFQPGTGGATLEIDIDVAKVSQYNSIFGVNQIVQDGYANGRLNDITIDESGTILGRYSNGQSQRMGQVVLTNFANPEGLHQVNGTAWRESYTSGSALIGEPGSSSLGRIRSGALEESNVDLTRELVTMIGAQRSFQANAQVISTYDTITETIINLRR
jgi:flagellar hook protein FlgE